MSLPDNNLYIIYKEQRIDFVNDLVNNDLIKYPDKHEMGVILNEVTFFLDNDEVPNNYNGAKYHYLLFGFNNKRFDQLIRSDYEAFFEWIKKVVALPEVLLLFLEGGSDASYYHFAKTELHQMFKTIPKFLGTGKLEFLQPLMYISNKAHGKALCKTFRKIDFFDVEEIEGHGFLAWIGGYSDRGYEIYDFASVYKEGLKKLK